jgi:MoxR-like ATPase
MSLIDQLIAYLEPRGMLGDLDRDRLRPWFAEQERQPSAPTDDTESGLPALSLTQARALIDAIADREPLLLVAPPGVGKTDLITEAARARGLPCRSVLGTQLAPEDLTGVPRIEGERTVFYPPRVILPEDNQPYCLFLDELPAASPDVQKAMYALLLERRIGERALPPGSWVIAAGNRPVDRAHVRPMGAALVNRVFVVEVRPTLAEWLAWAERNGVRPEIRRFLRFRPEALLRAPGDAGRPFSTPRAWAALSRALDAVAAAGVLDDTARRALAAGRLSADDAEPFCAMCERMLDLQPADAYLRGAVEVPDAGPERWLVLDAIRDAVCRADVPRVAPTAIRRFLFGLDPEERAALLVDRVPAWGALAGPQVMRALLTRYVREVGPLVELSESVGN